MPRRRSERRNAITRSVDALYYDISVNALYYARNSYY